MISKVDILKFVQHVAKRNTGRADKRLIHPEREWILGVSIAFCIGLAGAFYGSVFFMQQESLVERSVSGDTTAVRYRASTVEEALTLYAARRESFNELRGTYIPVVDMPQVVGEEGADDVAGTDLLRAE